MNYNNDNRNIPRQISVSDMAPHVHNFEYGENKADKLAKWLIDWINNSLKSKMIKYGDFLPSKSELAFHIGVSLGTMQNVFRIVEDTGLIGSKQRIGTFIIDSSNRDCLKKLTSKREYAIEEIKKYIIHNSYSVGDKLISARELSKISGLSVSTIRNALNTLVLENILEKSGSALLIKNIQFKIVELENLTLVKKIAKKIQEYIDNNKTKEKLPSNPELAALFNVSIKTVHDALKILSKEGIVVSKRGSYGTVITKALKSDEPYYYETVEIKIRNYITQNCKVGDKLPSIKKMAEKWKVSSKTIKKALDNLAEENYITFARGRYGGTFVIDIPQNFNDAYTWLALSPNYIQTNQN